MFRTGRPPHPSYIAPGKALDISLAHEPSSEIVRRRSSCAHGNPCGPNPKPSKLEASPHGAQVGPQHGHRLVETGCRDSIHRTGILQTLRSGQSFASRSASHIPRIMGRPHPLLKWQKAGRSSSVLSLLLICMTAKLPQNRIDTGQSRAIPERLRVERSNWTTRCTELRLLLLSSPPCCDVWNSTSRSRNLVLRKATFLLFADLPAPTITLLMSPGPLWSEPQPLRPQLPSPLSSSPALRPFCEPSMSYLPHPSPSASLQVH